MHRIYILSVGLGIALQDFVYAQYKTTIPLTMTSTLNLYQ